MTYHVYSLKKVKVAQSCLTFCNPVDCSSPGSSVQTIFPGKNTGVGFHFLLQGIFPTQGWNPGVPHCRQPLFHLSHQGSPFLQNAHILQMNTYKDYRRRGKIRNIKESRGIWSIELVAKLSEIFDSEFWHHM